MCRRAIRQQRPAPAALRGNYRQTAGQMPASGSCRDESIPGASAGLAAARDQLMTAISGTEFAGASPCVYQFRTGSSPVASDAFWGIDVSMAYLLL
jgi:hypothetical protein